MPAPFDRALSAAALLLCALLSACATPGGPRGEDHPAAERAAQQLLHEGRYEAAATAYETLAANAQSPARAQHYRLVAAELLFANGLPDAAIERSARLPSELANPALQARRQLLESAEALYLGDPSAALVALPAPAALDDDALRRRYQALRLQAGDALMADWPVFDAAIALDALEAGAQRETRNAQIWRLLTTRNELALEQLRANSASPVQRGWLALLDSLRAIESGRLEPRSTLAQWRQGYPDHPALALLAATGEDARATLALGTVGGGVQLGASGRIALMLPFDPPYTPYSEAIRDGLLSALYAGPTPRALRIYNIGPDPDNAAAVYRRAQHEGADVIIGPLRREALQSLLRFERLSTPLLALNYLAAGGAENLLQFGLSPEDEARDAANFLGGAGLRHAAVLYPDNDAGQRSAEAFRAQFERWGGQLHSAQALDTGRSDYREEISALLRINDSLQRRRDLQRTLGETLVFETHSRQDIEAIFAPVNSKTGRVLKPQLAFHSVTDALFVASSTVYGGHHRPRDDSDLNGAYFNDMPWLLGSGRGGESRHREAAGELGLLNGPLARFFALGVDAWQLLDQLPLMIQHPEHRFVGLSGQLSLGESNRITRQLNWARFEAGEPALLDKDFRPMAPDPAFAVPAFGDGGRGAPGPATPVDRARDY